MPETADSNTNDGITVIYAIKYAKMSRNETKSNYVDSLTFV